MQTFKYRRIAQRSLYTPASSWSINLLNITRPDITYSVHILSRFMHEPRQPHMAAALRVVRYLKLAPGQGLLLHSDNSLHLRAFCDSDPVTRCSTTRYCVFLGNSLIS